MQSIGFSDVPRLGGRRVNNTWVWANEDPITWTYWMPGTPTVGVDDCLYISLLAVSELEPVYSQWINYHCSSTTRSLCETYYMFW